MLSPLAKSNPLTSASLAAWSTAKTGFPMSGRRRVRLLVTPLPMMSLLMSGQITPSTPRTFWALMPADWTQMTSVQSKMATHSGLARASLPVSKPKSDIENLNPALSWPGFFMPKRYP